MFKLYLADFHLATFNRLSHLDDYVCYLVQSLSNNYTYDSFRITEVKKRPVLLFMNKTYEEEISYNEIAYWLDNGMAK